MPTAASGLGVSTAQARDIETDYAAFCRAARPMTTALAFTVGEIVVGGSVLLIQTYQPTFLTGFQPWFEHGGHELEVGVTAPAVLAALRGRKYLRSIFLGRLSVRRLVLVGAAVGCGAMLLSIVALLPVERPLLHVHGLVEGYEGASSLVQYVLAPFGEEMFYQVGLQTWLQRWGPVVAVIGVSLPFAASHFYSPLPAILLSLLPGCLAYAVVRQRTKSLGAALLAHSMFNVTASCFQTLPW